MYKYFELMYRNWSCMISIFMWTQFLSHLYGLFFPLCIIHYFYFISISLKSGLIMSWRLPHIPNLDCRSLGLFSNLVLPSAAMLRIVESVTHSKMHHSCIQVPCSTMRKHTYLAQRLPWSWRRFLQGEAFPLHYGWADPCEYP